MTRELLFLFSLSLLVSCGSNGKRQQVESNGNPTSDSLAVVNDPKNNLNLQISSFSEIDTSGVLMFPLSMAETEGKRGRLSYKEMPRNRYWNIIFYNSKTKEQHLLSERKMLIERYDYEYGSGESSLISQTPNHIFYTIRTDDFNKDKKLTEIDPQYLFVSDKFGNNFTQVSPTNYNLNNWKYVRSSNKVILTVGKDSDKNNRFDNSDEIATFEVELGNGTEAQEIFDENFKGKLKILFDRDWKRIKKE
jgi:hypothetical protein